MEITKHYRVPIQCDSCFVEGIVDDNLVDTDYFIKKIDEGVKEKNNMSNKTNVVGGMTSWKYFIEDKKFTDILKIIFDFLPNNDLPDLVLLDAWGIKMEEGHRTREHYHKVDDYSGTIYFNDSDVALQFPLLKVNVIPKKNKFLFFSGQLLHRAPPLTKGTRYAIAFNMTKKSNWD